MKLLSNKWIEEYDRHAPVPWPDLRTNNLEKIVSAALLEGWDELSEFDLEDFDLGNHLTFNLIEEFRQSDKHPIPIQSLSF